jgi:small-conductance mechanosensitive channel
MNSSAAYVTDTDPDNLDEKVPIDSWIIIRFNVTMNRGSVQENLKISPSLDPYGYRLEWGNDDQELTIKPNSALQYSKVYTISIVGAEDDDDNDLEDTSFEFETESQPSITEMISNVFNYIWNGILTTVPGIIILIVILILGYIVAKAASWVFSKVLTKLGFDKAMDKVGVSSQLKNFGATSASRFLGIFVFWFIFVIFLQIAIAYMGVPTITNILAPIVLFIPRILIAAIIILIGMYVANIIVIKLLDQFRKTAVGKQLYDIDSKTKTSGISVVRVVSLFIKVFILLFFVQIALEIVNIGLLSEFITPVLLIMPLVLVALFIILVGLLVAELISKALKKLIEQFEINKLIAPVEETIGRKGVVLSVFLFVVRIIVMLVFIQLAIGVLNSTGAFDQLAELINVMILWMPNVIAALIIIMIGFWFAGWVSKAVISSGRKVDIPFPETTATVVKYIIIYLAGVMAIAQLGFEVPILYIVTAIVIGGLFIGLGAGFAMGTKDVFSNIGGYIQTNKVLKIGSKISIDDKLSGTVKNIGHYATTIIDDKGKKVIIPNSQLIKSTIVELSPPPAPKSPPPAQSPPKELPKAPTAPKAAPISSVTKGM